MNVFDRWASRLIVGLVFVVPLFFSVHLQDTYDLPKLTLVYLGDLALVGLWLWQGAARGSFAVRRSALDVPLLMFLAVGALSAVFSLDPSLSVWGSYRTYIFGWVPMASFALLYWLTLQAASAQLKRRIFWAASISAACVGAYALMQYLGLEIFAEIPAVKGGRVWSSMGNPLYVGAVCMMAIVLGAGRWSAGSLLAMLLASFGLLNSLSRSAWLGSAAAVCVLLIFFRHRLRARGPKIFAGMVIAGVLAAAAPGVLGRLKVLASTRESSNAARIEGWKGGLRIWRSFPWLGSGPDTFFQAFRPYRTMAYIRATGGDVSQAHAHNEIIQMAATEGTIGLLAYAGLLFVFFRRGARQAAILSTGMADVCAALTALWIQDQFNFSTVATCAWAATFLGLFFASDEISTLWKCRRPLAPLFKGGIIALGIAGVWAILIPVRADWQYKQGLAWAQGGHYLAALPHFREAVRLNGRIEIYQSGRANAARSAGLWDEAWDTARSVTAAHPHDPDAWNNQGVGAMWMVQLAGRDHWQDAKTSFEQATRLDPVFVDAWANLAKWEHLQGHPDEEKQDWRKVLSLDPQHAMARQMLGVR